MSTATGTAGVQGPLWNTRAKDWYELQEQCIRPLPVEVARVAVKPGMRVLDIACGAGFFAQLAAQAGATVSGIDASSELLAYARQRTPSGDFREGEMIDLPWPDHTFDLVTGFNAFQYSNDFVKALSEAKRVTKPGGHVVIALWGKDEDCELSVTLKALGPLMPPPPPGAPGPLALGQDGLIPRLATEAGLTPGEFVNVDCPVLYPDLETALRALLSAGPVVRVINHAGEEAVREATADSLKPFRLSDGSYRLENKFRYMITTA